MNNNRRFRSSSIRSVDSAPTSGHSTPAFSSIEDQVKEQIDLNNTKGVFNNEKDVLVRTLIANAIDKSIKLEKEGKISKHDFLRNSKLENDENDIKEEKSDIKSNIKSNNEPISISDVYKLEGRSFFLFSPKNRFRLFLRDIVITRFFQNLFIWLILLNVLMMSFESPDYSPSTNKLLHLFDSFFGILFIIEILMKSIVQGFIFGRNDYLRSKANLIDFLIVVSVLPFFVNLTSFRMLRLIRPILQARSRFKGIKSIIKSISKSFVLLINVVILALFFLVMFSLMGMQLFHSSFSRRCSHTVINKFNETVIEPVYPEKFCKIGFEDRCFADQICVDGYENPDYGFTSFDSFPSSIFTLFRVSTYDGFASIMHTSQEAEFRFSSIFYVSVIFFVGFLVLNLFAAVVSSTFLGDVAEEGLFSVSRGKINKSSLVLREKKNGEYFFDILNPDGSREHFSEFWRSKFALKIRSLVLNSTFEKIIACFILLNAILMSMDSYSPDPTKFQLFISSLLPTANIVFNTVYSIEVILKILAYRGFKRYLKKKTNLFDFFVISSSLIASLEGVEPFSSSSVISILRIFKLFQILRIIDKFPVFEIVLQKTGGTLKALINVLLFIGFNLFMFSVLNMQVFSGFDENDRMNFNSLAESFLTLFTIMSGEEWTTIVYSTLKNAEKEFLKTSPDYFTFKFKYILSISLLITWYIFSAYIMLSLYIAVILENFELSDKEKRKIQRKRYIKGRGKSVASTIKTLDKISSNKNNIENNEEDEGREGILYKIRMKLGLYSHRIPHTPGLGLGAPRLKRNIVEPLFNNHSYYDPRVRRKQIPDDLEDNKPWNVKRPLFVSKIYNNESELHTNITFKGIDTDSFDKTNEEIMDWMKIRDSENNIEASKMNDNEIEMSSLNRSKSKSDFRKMNKFNLKKNKSINNLNSEASSTSSILSSVSSIFSDISSRTQKYLSDISSFSDIDNLSAFSPAAPIQLRDYIENKKNPLSLLQSTEEFDAKEDELVIQGKKKLGNWFFIPITDRWYYFHVIKPCKSIMKSSWFNRGIIIVIILSSISLALEAPAYRDNVTLRNSLFYLEYFWVFIFLLEFFIKSISYGLFETKFSYFNSTLWNLVDFIVLISSISSLIFSSESKWMVVIRIGRLLKPLLLINKMKVLQFIISALVTSIPNLISVATVTFLIFSIFAVIGMSLFKGKLYFCTDPDALGLSVCSGDYLKCNNDLCYPTPRVWKNPNQNFDNFFASLLTVFEVSTLEQWVPIMQRGMDINRNGPDLQPSLNSSFGYSIYFVIVVSIGSFFVLKLFLGVIINQFNRKTGYALLTESQKAWVDVRKRLIVSKPTKRPRRPYSKISGIFYDLIFHKYFGKIINALIIMNVLLVIIESAIGGESDYQKIIDMFHNTFLFLFWIEAIFKFIALRKKYFKSNWNIFDLFLIGSSSLIIVSNFLVSGYYIKSAVFHTLRAFRALRLLRIVHSLRMLRVLFNTLIISLPMILSIMIALVLLFFIYTIAGIHLFGNIKFGNYINSNANFQDPLSGMLTMFTIFTGEDWNGFMQDSFVEYPLCTLGIDGDCGSFNTGLIFFHSFYIIASLIMSEVMFAILLENFSYTYNQEEAVVSYTSLRKFKFHWLLFDPEGTGLIPYWRLKDFISTAPSPFFIDPVKNRELFKFIVQELRMIDEDDESQVGIPFNDVLMILAAKEVGVESLLYEDVVERRRSTMKVYRNLSATRINAIVRGVLLRRKVLSWIHETKSLEEIKDSVFLKKFLLKYSNRKKRYIHLHANDSSIETSKKKEFKNDMDIDFTLLNNNTLSEDKELSELKSNSPHLFRITERIELASKNRLNITNFQVTKNQFVKLESDSDNDEDIVHSIF